jgi:hypothetical protein
VIRPRRSRRRRRGRPPRRRGAQRLAQDASVPTQIGVHRSRGRAPSRDLALLLRGHRAGLFVRPERLVRRRGSRGGRARPARAASTRGHRATTSARDASACVDSCARETQLNE